MKTRWPSRRALLLAAAGAASIAIAAPRLERRWRPAGSVRGSRELELSIVMQGCFNGGSYTTRVRREARDAWTASVPGHALRVALTGAEVANLDRGIRWWRRHAHDGSCTSSIRIAIVQLDGGRELSREEIFDSSCDHEDDGDRSGTAIFALTHRLDSALAFMSDPPPSSASARKP